MTDTSSASVGRVAIDAYLDSVEQALIVAHAPRSPAGSSRFGIADCRHAGPTTGAADRGNCRQRHPETRAAEPFGRTYGNGKESTPSASDRFAQVVTACRMFGGRKCRP